MQNGNGDKRRAERRRNSLPVAAAGHGTEREEPERNEDDRQRKWPIRPRGREQLAETFEGGEPYVTRDRLGLTPQNGGHEVSGRHHGQNDHGLRPSLRVVDLLRRVVSA